MVDLNIPFCLAIFSAALCYSSVGHGGASAYLAILSLLSIPKETAVPVVLILNILVSGTAYLGFKRAGHFRHELTWPFVLGSLPAAYIGGTLKISEAAYSILLSLALCFAALKIIMDPPMRCDSEVLKRPSFPVAVITGSLMGLISGMIGIGGGVFLSPLLLLKGWADAKQTAAASACFILINSAAAFIGRARLGVGAFPPIWIPFIISGFAGGWIGSCIGAGYFSHATLRKVLGAVLGMASFKLLYSCW